MPYTTNIRSDDRYIPSLDGLRAASIAMVVLAHMGLGHTLVPGGFGVTLFFFISGFLITRLLLSELRTTGKISIIKFYFRRFLRLGPSLLVMIAGVSLIFYILNGYVVGREIYASVFYFANYYYILARHFEMPLGALWSIAVEEHYYLFFPIALAVFATNLPRFIRILVALCILILIWRICVTYVFNDPSAGSFAASRFYTYRATDARIDSILYGALLSLLLELKGNWIERHVTDIRLLALCIAALLLTFLYRDEGFRSSFRYTIQGLALMPLMTALLFSPDMRLFSKVLEFEPVVWLGKISYSLYLWHIAALVFLRNFDPNMSTALWIGLSTIAMLFMASTSYYLIERPLIGLRRRLRPKHRFEPEVTDRSFPIVEISH